MSFRDIFQLFLTSISNNFLTELDNLNAENFRNEENLSNAVNLSDEEEFIYEPEYRLMNQVSMKRRLLHHRSCFQKVLHFRRHRYWSS